MIGSKPKPPVEVVKDTVSTAPPVAVDTTQQIEQDTAAVEQSQTENTQTSNITGDTPGGMYQIILGCFLERYIAEKFVSDLQGRGYDARMPSRLSGEWNIVIVYESNDINEAAKVRDEFVAFGYEDAWIRTRGGVRTDVTTSQSLSYASASNGSVRGRYQTVVGCFLYRENAERFFNIMKNNGFDAKLSERPMGDWNLVFVCETDDLDEAKKAKEQCLAAGYDAWIRQR